MTRTSSLALAALVLLAALPAAAAPAPAAPAPATALSSCGQAVLGALALPAPAAASPALPGWLAGAQPAATTVFHGFCHCTCSRVPDCNTNADCSNHRCLGAITCC